MSQGLASRSAASSHGTDPIRVLVVDDSSVIRGIVSRWIDSASETTLFGAAINGQDALERVKSDKPDIIVLDIEMPGMDGITALPLLLKACPQAKIIMASTLTRRCAASRARNRGASRASASCRSSGTGHARACREPCKHCSSGSSVRAGGRSGHTRRNPDCRAFSVPASQGCPAAAADPRHRILDGRSAGPCHRRYGDCAAAQRASSHHAAHAADLHIDPGGIPVAVFRAEVR